MKKSFTGKCKICGKRTDLTFEHVPPEKAFNSEPVFEYPVEEAIKTITGTDGRMPWDFSGLKGRINQRGGGAYYLCSECNNNTGSWYIAEYVRLTKIIDNIIKDKVLVPKEEYGLLIDRFYPLRVFKAIMMMFCDINFDCFGDEQLRRYILNKESKEINLDKYSVYTYLVGRGMRREASYAVSIQ